MPLVFTLKGRNKLAAVELLVRQAAEQALAAEMVRMRNTAARFAPPPGVEAALLSEGFATSGPVSGQVIGTPAGGRFIRAGAQVSLQEAIRTAPLQQVTTDTRVTVGACSAAAINARTGFYWNTRRRGLQGPTEPFNRAYVQAVENGGVVWYVTPREGTTALEPEPGLFAGSMAKTMRPFRMFAAARTEARVGMPRRVRPVLRRAVREVGRA